MSEFKLDQEFVDRVTCDDSSDVSVIGVCTAQMPTIQEAFRAQYIAHMVKAGVPAEFAAETYDAADPRQYDDCMPEEAAQDEMDCWTDDDGPVG